MTRPCRPLPCLAAILAAGLLALPGLAQHDPLAMMDALVKVSNLSSEKKHEEAIAELGKLLAVQGTPRWFVSSCHFTLAAEQLRLGRTDAALDSLEKSIETGFDNYVNLHEVDANRPLFTNERFQKLYARMKISAADVRELFWLKAEIQQTFHETNMMITENIGRQDRDQTGIPQITPPDRPTTSVAVETYRVQLRWAQRFQVNMVRQSDQSRVQHLINQAITRSMPSGGPDDAARRRQMELRQQEEELRSRLAAQQRYQARYRAAVARQFRLPEGTGTTPEPCPPLGSLKPAAAPQAGAGAGADAPNPLKDNVKVGDSAVYSRSFTQGGQTVASEHAYKVSAFVEGKVTYEVESKKGEETKTEQENLTLQPSLKEQILADLKQAGAVELLEFKVAEDRHTFQGAQVPVQKVTLRFHWTLSDQKSLWSGTYLMSAKVRSFGYYEVKLSSEGTEYRQALVRHVPAAE